MPKGINISTRALLKSALSVTASLGFSVPFGSLAQVISAHVATIKIAVIEVFSGAFANTGDAVFRNLLWATERVNAQGGVAITGGASSRLELKSYESKGQVEEALAMLRSAIDDGAQIIMQGNSSSVAAALIDAINKHNKRTPDRRLVFFNYSAVDPILTNEKSSPWHFRFDAHADMRMAALMQVLRQDRALKSVYLIGQNYSFGQAVLREARRHLAAQHALALSLNSTAFKRGIDANRLSRQLSSVRLSLFGKSGFLRVADHQFQQPLVVGVMDRQGTSGRAFRRGRIRLWFSRHSISRCR